MATPAAEPRLSDEGPDYRADLEVDEDLQHEVRQWRAQIVTGAGTTIVLLLAILGLFGGGPLSWATATDGTNRIAVDYDRFLRRTGNTELQIHVDSSAARDGSFQIVLDRDYVDRFQVSAITPEPDAVDAVDGGLRYTFTATTPATDLDVSVQLRPTGLWRQHGRVRLPGADSVEFWQFTFP